MELSDNVKVAGGGGGGPEEPPPAVPLPQPTKASAVTATRQRSRTRKNMLIEPRFRIHVVLDSSEDYTSLCLPWLSRSRTLNTSTSLKRCFNSRRHRASRRDLSLHRSTTRSCNCPAALVFYCRSHSFHWFILTPCRSLPPRRFTSKLLGAR